MAWKSHQVGHSPNLRTNFMKVKTPDPIPAQSVPDVPAATGLLHEDIHQREHFRTDHLLANLKKHTISSGAVTLSAQVAKFS